MNTNGIYQEDNYGNFSAYFSNYDSGFKSINSVSVSLYSLYGGEINYNNIEYGWDKKNSTINFRLSFDANKFIPLVNYSINCTINAKIDDDMDQEFTLEGEYKPPTTLTMTASTSVSEENSNAKVKWDTKVYLSGDMAFVNQLQNSDYLNFGYVIYKNYSDIDNGDCTTFSSNGLSGIIGGKYLYKDSFSEDLDNYSNYFESEYVDDFNIGLFIEDPNGNGVTSTGLILVVPLKVDISNLDTIPTAPVIDKITNLSNHTYTSWLQAPSTSVPFLSSISERKSLIGIDINTLPSGKYGAGIDHYNFYINGTIVDSWIYDSSKKTGIFCLVPSVSVDTDTTFQITAVDTRDEESPKSDAKGIYIFAYKKPKLFNIKASRKNNFEKETSINCSANYLPLNNLNTVTLKATCSELWYGEKTITTSTDKGLDDTTGYKLAEFQKIFSDSSYTDTSLYTKPGFDIEKSFNVTFTLTDRTGMAVSATCFVPQGVPLFTQTETGINAIGMIPKWDSPCKLQVNSDILAKDSDGNEIEIINAIKNLIKLTTDENEPTQATGSYWIKATEITNTIT